MVQLNHLEQYKRDRKISLNLRSDRSQAMAHQFNIAECQSSTFSMVHSPATAASAFASPMITPRPTRKSRTLLQPLTCDVTPKKDKDSPEAESSARAHSLNPNSSTIPQQDLSTSTQILISTNNLRQRGVSRKRVAFFIPEQLQQAYTEQDKHLLSAKMKPSSTLQNEKKNDIENVE